jgi:hypothetical protein
MVSVEKLFKIFISAPVLVLARRWFLPCSVPQCRKQKLTEHSGRRSQVKSASRSETALAVGEARRHYSHTVLYCTVQYSMDGWGWTDRYRLLEPQRPPIEKVRFARIWMAGFLDPRSHKDGEVE